MTYLVLFNVVSLLNYDPEHSERLRECPDCVIPVQSTIAAVKPESRRLKSSDDAKVFVIHAEVPLPSLHNALNDLGCLEIGSASRI